MFYSVGSINGEKSKIFTSHPSPSTLLSLFLLTTRISSLSVPRLFHFVFRWPSLLISFQLFHLSSSKSRNLYMSHKQMTVSMTLGNFFESLWAYGIINTHTLGSANEMAPTCMPPLALIGRKSTDVQVDTMLLAMHFLSWTLVGCKLHIFRN